SRPLTGGLLRKGHKYGGAPAGNLHFIKKILNRQALRRAFPTGSGCPAAQSPPDSCRKGTIASRSETAVRGKRHRQVPGRPAKSASMKENRIVTETTIRGLLNRPADR